jgi:hypothetical protein
MRRKRFVLYYRKYSTLSLQEKLVKKKTHHDEGDGDVDNTLYKIVLCKIYNISIIYFVI